jgi:hypothetical protein
VGAPDRRKRTNRSSGEWDRFTEVVTVRPTLCLDDRGLCMRAVVVVAGLCAVLAVAGCSKSQPGAPQASATTLSEGQLWDPCSLPDSAISAAGADPGSKDTNTFGAPQPGWKGCAWRAGHYFLNVYVTNHTLDEISRIPKFRDVQDVNVSGRRAISYYLESSPPDNCIISIPTSGGLVEVDVNQAAGDPSAGDYCGIAEKSEQALDGTIPH